MPLSNAPESWSLFNVDSDISESAAVERGAEISSSTDDEHCSFPDECMDLSLHADFNSESGDALSASGLV